RLIVCPPLVRFHAGGIFAHIDLLGCGPRAGKVNGAVDCARGSGIHFEVLHRGLALLQRSTDGGVAPRSKCSSQRKQTTMRDADRSHIFYFTFWLGGPMLAG